VLCTPQLSLTTGLLYVTGALHPVLANTGATVGHVITGASVSCTVTNIVQFDLNDTASTTPKLTVLLPKLKFPGLLGPLVTAPAQLSCPTGRV